MTAISGKPVKQCRGCELNLGKTCGVFEFPVLIWKKHACQGFNDPIWIAYYNRQQHPSGAKARKLQRAQRAREAHTVVHKDGVHPLVKLR